MEKPGFPPSHTGEESRPKPGDMDLPFARSKWECALLWILGLTLVLAVSHQSLWIDELCTAIPAGKESLRGCWDTIYGLRHSELQMPIFMLYTWSWVRIFGDGEWALRASGLLWVVPGLVAMASGFARRSERISVMLAAVTSAFVWYYSGEARPYAMQLGASCLIFGALLRLGRNNLKECRGSLWLSAYLFGFLLLCGSSLTGVIWSIGALLAALIVIPSPRLWELLGKNWIKVLLTIIGLLVLGCYYFWTLRLGARATAIARSDLKTVAFIFYEQLGLAGLGPGRTDLRQGGLQTLRPYLIPLGVYFLLLLILLGNGFLRGLHLKRPGRIAALSFAVAVPACMLLAVGVATHFRVLGRHFTPMMPVWTCLLGLGLGALVEAGWKGRAVAAVYLLFSVWSCVSIRFALRHERDDYRDAAIYASDALRHHQTVWWNADGDGAHYYNLSLDTDEADKDHAVLVDNPSADSLPKLKKPDVVISSKADIYDASGALADYLARNHFQVSAQYPAFTIWRN